MLRQHIQTGVLKDETYSPSILVQLYRNCNDSIVAFKILFLNSVMPAPAVALCWRKMNIVMTARAHQAVMKTVMRIVWRMKKKEIRHLDQSETAKKKKTALIK